MGYNLRLRKFEITTWNNPTQKTPLIELGQPFGTRNYFQYDPHALPQWYPTEIVHNKTKNIQIGAPYLEKLNLEIWRRY